MAPRGGDEVGGGRPAGAAGCRGAWRPGGADPAGEGADGLHISEGILSGAVLAGGAVPAAAGVAAGLWRLRDEAIPRVAVVSAGFFVASLVHVPVGPTSAHLLLNGLAGVVLGWAAFPAMLVALVLQAVLFGFGGLTTLGVNVTIMAVPAVACHYLFGPGIRRGGRGVALVCGALAGGSAVLGSGLLACVALATTGRALRTVAELVLLAHVPVALVEALVTGGIVVFLRQVRPEVLAAGGGQVEEMNEHD